MTNGLDSWSTDERAGLADSAAFESSEAERMSSESAQPLTDVVDSGSNPRPVFLNKSLSLGAISLLQGILPAVLTGSLLYVIARLRDAVFDDFLIALALVSAALMLAMVRPQPFSGARMPAKYLVKQAISLLWRWAGVLAVMGITAYVTDFQRHYPADIIAIWAIATPVGILSGHWFLGYLSRRIMRSQELVRSSVIVGVNDVSRTLAERIRKNPELGFRVKGFFDDRSLERVGHTNGLEMLGSLTEIGRYVRNEDVDVIFIVLPMRHIQRVMEMLDELRDSTVSIYYVPDLFVCDLIQSRISDIVGVPVVSMCETPFCGYKGVLKRASDVILCLAVLIPALPVMAVIALLVRLTSRGPIIFKQYRYGLDGESIKVYKFRSMYVTEDGDSVPQATRDDPRVTPIGEFLRKTSLDELPQLFNVLQGRMSLVGPRPHAVAHNEEFRGQIKGYMIRHKVLPGITGLAQINGCRGETSELADMQARVHYDLEYLKHWSPWLDFKILLWTGVKVLKADKAY